MSTRAPSSAGSRTPAAARPHSALLSMPGLTLFAVAQVSDLVTFIAMLERRGPSAEINPVALAFLDANHLGLLLVAKIAAWALAAACAACLAPRWPQLARLVVAFGIVAGFLGACSNLLTI